MITQVHQDSPERSISRLCEILQVSRSWYYEKQTRPEASEADVELCDATVNHKRVLRIMREESRLVPINAAVCPYDGLAASPTWVYPNLVKGMIIFAV